MAAGHLRRVSQGAQPKLESSPPTRGEAIITGEVSCAAEGLRCIKYATLCLSAAQLVLRCPPTVLFFWGLDLLCFDDAPRAATVQLTWLFSPRAQLVLLPASSPTNHHSPQSRSGAMRI